MKTIPRLAAVIGILVILLSTGCGRSQSIYDGKLEVLGTLAGISIAGLPDAESITAVGAVEQDLRQLDQVGYTFSSEGELHELNETIARGGSRTVSPELRDLILNARELYRASGGLFNPAAGELVALWEFHCNKADCTESPYPEEVQQLVEEKAAAVIAMHPSMEDLVLNGNEVSSKNPSVRLEFGDMIRGYALDKGMAHLKKLDISNAMIELGGSVRSVGSRGEHPWWNSVTGIGGVHSVGYIELGEDEAVVTVRAFDRSIGKQDFVYRHVVDPRTGLPVREVNTVTIIHDSAAWANAAATTLLISGIDDWASVASKMGARSVMIIMQDGTMYTSTTMEERLHWNQRTEHQHLVP